MSHKAFFLASLPLMVAPLISLAATPAKAVSTNSKLQMSSEVMSASNNNSLLIADRYDNAQNDNRRQHNRSDNQWRRDQDNQGHHDRNDYRWHHDRNNDWQYRDRNRAGVIFRF
ncbi:MAG: hypothetical protein JO235_19640 [Chroococcidiopsidaceae cyanobacterium CP_BM_RX_35]|nr:hypothetical protein [Chroococcidiopsidaceae cyanobacterium CP_BM_RX_35]